jgi:hypothetical protein
MRKSLDRRIAAGRVTEGAFASCPEMGANGAFLIEGPAPNWMKLKIIASDGTDPEAKGWEHVSVSTPNRCPNWIEMCFVKDLFWDDEETVVQFHPPHSEYVNCHPFTLHLWRHRWTPIATPPSYFVGPK